MKRTKRNTVQGRDHLRNQAALINKLMEARGIPVAVRKYPCSPAHVMFAFDMADSFPVEKLRGALPDIERMIHAYRRQHHLIPSGKFKTVARLNSLDGAFEVTRPDRKPLNYSTDIQWKPDKHSIEGFIGRTYNPYGAMDIVWNIEDPEEAHVLIGGMSGSGKSNAMLVMILSLCQYIGPDRLAIDIIDLKRTPECRALAENLPHVHNLAVEPDDAADLIAHYKRVVDERERGNEATDCHRILIIDEAAELLVNGVEYDQSLASVAAKGRSSNMHLMLCTQRPTTDVIGKLVRPNLNVALCGLVRDAREANIVTGVSKSGAEKSPGRGSFTYTCGSAIMTVQVPFMDDLNSLLNSVRESWSNVQPVQVLEPVKVERSVQVQGSSSNSQTRTVQYHPNIGLLDELFDLYEVQANGSMERGWTTAAVHTLCDGEVRSKKVQGRSAYPNKPPTGTTYKNLSDQIDAYVRVRLESYD